MIALVLMSALVSGFVEPPVSAAPHVWWHWMNGQVTKEGIAADLKSLADNGFGGAVIVDAGKGREGAVPFAGETWFDHVAFAVSEAKKRGLKIGVGNCSGWSCSGGPWVAASNAMKRVVWSETRVAGPAHFSGRLPEPEDTHGFYKDVAVVAFPLPDAEKEGVPRYEAADERPGDFEVVRTFDFGVPRRVSGIAVDVEGGCGWIEQALVRVESSDDGARWSKVAFFRHSVNESGRSHGLATYSFTALSSRWFRVTVQSVRSYPRDQERKRYVVKTLEPTLSLRLSYLKSKAYYVKGETKPDDVTALPSQVVDPERVRVLSCRADGALDFDVPPGDWMLMRFGYAANGMNNHPATKGGKGPEVDKFDRRALDAHFDAYLGRLVADLTRRGLYAPDNESGLVAALVDSYEVGTQNWTHGFEGEFERLKGYSPIPMLAAFSGRIVKDVPTTERYLADVRDVCNALFLENYARHFAERCHDVGLEFQLEGYGNGPFDGDDYMRCADLPMGEFWNRGSLRDHRHMLELAVRAGRAAGRKVYGAEAFTANPGEDCWSKSPFGCKEVGDLAFETGINRLYLHAYVHQPYTDDRHRPGLSMGKWGTHFDRNSTWWPQARAWVKYLSRCQYLLQEGRYDGSRDGVPRRVYADGTVGYFIRTSEKTASVSNIVFSVAGRRAEIWHPVTGRMMRAEATADAPGKTRVTVPLDPLGSVFVMFPPVPSSGLVDEQDKKVVKTRIPLERGWTLMLGARKADLDAPGDWTKSHDRDVRYFSGTGTYRTSFKVSEATMASCSRFCLDLGDIREIATVVLNGKEHPAVWCPPFRVDVTDAVRSGDNDLIVRVTNLWCNRLIGDAGLPPGQRTTWTTLNWWKPNDEPLPSGLLGPAVIEGLGAPESADVFLNRKGGFEWPAAGVFGTASLNWDNWHASAQPSDFSYSDTSYDFISGHEREVFATGCWKMAGRDNGSVGLSNAIVLKKGISGVDCLGSRILLRHSDWRCAEWKTDSGRGGRLPADTGRKGLFRGEISALTFTRPDGFVLRVTMPKPTSIHISNDSAWCGSFSVRFVHAGDFATGDTLVDDFVLSCPSRELRAGGFYSETAKANDEWVPMDFRKIPAKGSVLDFSPMALTDGPCGKYGRVRRVKDHFEFEKRPGVRMRFAGANILGDCCVLESEEAMDELVRRVLASGYNSMRLHHIDCVAGILKKGTDPSEGILDPKRLDKLDRFVAKCYSKGIYLTIDLFSLRPFSWKSMGIDRDGNMHFQLAKAFIHLTDAGFESWRKYASALLNHVNPYTGHAWKDEPGLPLVCLVNEAGLTQSWKWIRECPELAAQLGRTLEEIRKLRGGDEFDRLCDRVERTSFARMKAFVTSLGLKALVTDLNNGPHPKVKHVFRAEKLDYFDNHFYFDHPNWLGERLKLPAKQRMLEILDYPEEGKSCRPGHVASKRSLPDMPYTVTEWNFNAPNASRSGGGLYLGAVAAAEGWDGLWRFTWAHAAAALRDQTGPLGFFDVMRDPIMYLNDRTFVALYLRNDASCLSPGSPYAAAGASFSVETPRTQGVYLSEAGQMKTAALSVRSDGRCTVAATAVDAGESLAESRRILVTHLTDCVNAGMTWLDPSRTILSSMGKGPLLVRTGAAEIELALDPKRDYEVWACATDGTRLNRVAAMRTPVGGLRFVAAVQKDKGVAMVYEVASAR